MRVLTYYYDSINYNPSAPVIDVIIDEFSKSAGTESISAFLDSGADATMLPIDLLMQLEAASAGVAIISGITPGKETVRKYFVSVSIGAHKTRVEAVGLRKGQQPIIGRDVLNHFEIKLNGPASATEIFLE